MSELVIVGVCTFHRPIMLADCLKSLAVQSIPHGLELAIVVVDNEPEPNRQNYVSEFAVKCQFPVYYVHQPRQGIACARNAVLDKATQLGAAWIAMLDDDETAAPDWVQKLMAPEYRDTPVLSGQRIFVYPQDVPFWAKLKQKSTDRELAIELDLEGAERRIAHTNNVRFSISLIEAGLRFDERLGMMGGEDQEFFSRAHSAGFKIKRTSRAVTYEAAHPERLTFGGQFYRFFWYSVSNTRIRLLRGEKRDVYWECLYEVPLDLIIGTLRILGSPLRVFKGREKFKRRANSGAKQIAQAIGVVTALLGIMPKPYRKTVGQ